MIPPTASTPLPSPTPAQTPTQAQFFAASIADRSDPRLPAVSLIDSDEVRDAKGDAHAVYSHGCGVVLPQHHVPLRRHYPDRVVFRGQVLLHNQAVSFPACCRMQMKDYSGWMCAHHRLRERVLVAD